MHIEPEASSFVQLPTPPFVGAMDASHGSGLHVAGVKTPKEHDASPLTVYPLSHVG